MRYHNSHAHHLRHQPMQPQQMAPRHNSVPNSPNETELGGHRSARSGPNSAATSPIPRRERDQHRQQSSQQHTPSEPYNFVRTSRSEDQLQGQNDLCRYTNFLDSIQCFTGRFNKIQHTQCDRLMTTVELVKNFNLKKRLSI